MCEVCAVFGLGRHWTDAGTLANPRLPAPDIARYRVERRRRIQLFNALLAGTGIVLSDWTANRSGLAAMTEAANGSRTLEASGR